MKKIIGMMVCALAACACVAAAEQRWRDDLWLGRGGYWRARVGVTVENTSDEAWEGRSVSVPLAKLPLAGARVVKSFANEEVESSSGTACGTDIPSSSPRAPCRPTARS